MSGRRTVLFLDEVHRFNKAQQDAFLPWVEDGTLTFIGATTENPSFELNNALLSRARVYVLKALDAADLRQVLQRALDEADGLPADSADDEALDLLVAAADGDARRALNLLELAADLLEEGRTGLTRAEAERVIDGGRRRFDNKGEQFYDQISALHKSIRGSDPDAALYWLMRMLDGGCDPRYVARRLLRMASEDIGKAVGEALADVREFGSLDVPMHLRNAPTSLMKGLGYGEGYRYAHDEDDGVAWGENYFPDDMPERTYYHPVPRGLEEKIATKLARIRERKSRDKR
jgi:putative ATPase